MAKLARLTAKLKAAGLAARTKSRDRTRSMRRRAHAIGAWLRKRSDDAKEEVKAINAEMAAIAAAAVGDARAVARNARRGLRRAAQQATARTAALVAELERTAELVERVAAQTRIRLAGEVPDGATRIVSLHDPDARPIAKGRLGRPVEFGYKAQIVDNADGIVLDHTIEAGNPPDAPMLVPAIARIKRRFGKAPRAVTADRGYGEAGVDTDLETLGVKRVAIPRRGRPGAARQSVERAGGFRRLIKWRTGCEGRISSVKRSYGWRRTLNNGLHGAQTWCAWGILAHNATKVVAVINDRDQRLARRCQTASTPRPAAAGPPPRPPPPRLVV